MHPITFITVDLSHPVPAGQARLIVRLTPQARSRVTIAAERLGLSQADFMRIVLVHASEKVLTELGLTPSDVTHMEPAQ